MQHGHADDGYSRRGNFALVHSMSVMYSPDGTNIYSSRVRSLRGQGQRRGLKVVKSCSYGTLPIQLFRQLL